MKRIFKKTKNSRRLVRSERVRARVSGTAERPRLSVFRGLRQTSAQLINDAIGKTVCAASTKEIKGKKVEGKSGKIAAALLLGRLIAEKAASKGIKKVVFDRGGYKYHGRVAAVAEGAREGGLEF